MELKLFSLILFITFMCLTVNSAVSQDVGSGRQRFIPPSTIIETVVNTTTGVFWFYDDNGNLVKPTFDIPRPFEIAFSRVDDKVVFRLHTRNKIEGEVLILNNAEKLKSTSFNASRETVFITHGWINSARSLACTLVRDAYLKKTDYNVIVVDWSRISFRPYGWAASHTRKVGRHVAKMINFLETQGMDLKKLKLIGHSLGAQVMGSAGYAAKNQVNYIVGLDPALPLFYSSTPGVRISTLDAKNVEIIHTNGGLLGILVPVGHVDFYPNGGQRQAGCVVDPGGACSHLRAPMLFAESIVTNTGFYGKPCRSYLQVLLGRCSGRPYLMGGLKTTLTRRGSFLLRTRPFRPRAMGNV